MLTDKLTTNGSASQDEGWKSTPSRRARHQNSVSPHLSSGNRPRAPQFNNGYRNSGQVEAINGRSQLPNKGNSRPQRVSSIGPPLSNGWQWKNRDPHPPGYGGQSSKNGEISKFEEAGYSELGKSGGKTAKFRSDLEPAFLPFEQSGKIKDPSSNYDLSGGSNDENVDFDDENDEEDELMWSDDDCDSDGGELSSDMIRNSKWFKGFFALVSSLRSDEINEPNDSFHCPACKGGVGEVEWYRGLQPILSHAKTLSSKRVKLHRKFAEILEEELRSKGANFLVLEEMVGRWRGLQADNDREIVWPPMVIIQNTRFDHDDQGQWLGMRNEDLMEYFSGYKAMKARNAYGPSGHRGIGLLIFESSAMGYLEAERLHKHFLKEGRGKDEWENHRGWKHSAGKRILYGYMATKEEMEIFNRHSKGKQKVKYDIESYHMMVVEPLKKMDEDNQELLSLHRKVSKEIEHSKTLEETCNVIGQNLRIREQEIKIIRQRATEQLEESKEEMDYLDRIYEEKIRKLTEDLEKREKQLEKVQDALKTTYLDRCLELEMQFSTIMITADSADGEQKEKKIRIEEEMARQAMLAEISLKNSEDYELEKQSLLEAHHKKLMEAKCRHREEEVALEREMEKKRIELLQKYTLSAQPKESDLSQ
ncbi:protein SUPPRESSOR OF GENE SILENCING 3 homolog [Amborella trichopoda]|uniref:XS domain-containing protein n=1 Tax=Amborella trichopoda TaxID=13333 RepID=U5DE41_AMBTC|nr:protein SUPPRESSOR OF GENE SILENCING 3 homolog [Amborella trichopoda]ERN18678.1 hypothetical protein AMTR_s00065p00199990 [Amborella trichopoda]|eukprot:XP_006857211.1 protein SUPPRESSOR OF GENE SILENCING 3 homolog [Amborella trichopoda]